MQEELFACICVDLFINWEKPFEDVSENKFDPSVVMMSLHYQEEELALKSPVIADKEGLRLFMPFNNFFHIR